MGDQAGGATFSVVAVAKLVEFAGSRGVDGAQVARAAGLRPEALRDPEQRIGIAKLYASWEILMDCVDEPGLPIEVARSYRVEDLHVMGFALMTSSNVREAVDRAIRYFALLSNSGRWRIEEDGDDADIHWWREGALTLGHRLANEAALATFLHTFRQVLGEQVAASVSFRHVAPDDTSVHRRFFKGTVRFGAAEDVLTVPRAVFERVPRTANPELSAFFEHHAESLLPRYTQANLADRVREAITLEMVSGRLTVGAVARRLGLSERSLRRRLEEAQGPTFRELRNEVLRARAQELLRRPDASVTDVAFLLGFSDSSAFTRACKRWFGQTPKELRGR